MNMYIENIVLTVQSAVRELKGQVRMWNTKKQINQYYNAQTRPEKFFIGF